MSALIPSMLAKKLAPHANEYYEKKLLFAGPRTREYELQSLLRDISALERRPGVRLLRRLNVPHNYDIDRGHIVPKLMTPNYYITIEDAAKQLNINNSDSKLGRFRLWWHTGSYEVVDAPSSHLLNVFAGEQPLYHYVTEFSFLDELEDHDHMRIDCGWVRCWFFTYNNDF